MKVVEIFKSIEGEGVRAGLPVTFIRLYGCNLRCEYCDTKYSYDEANEENAHPYCIMTVEQIVEAVMCFGCQTVTITGGEPLIHSGIERLIDLLLLVGCEINIETNGTRPIPHKYKNEKRVIVTMDYKCPGSGMNDRMERYPFDTLRDWDVLKFVVSDERDLDKMVEVLGTLETTPSVFVSPVFSKIEPVQIVEYLLSHQLHDVRIQLQLHKIIWDPDRRGV